MSESIPILLAVEASFSPPSSEAIWAKTVLIDLRVASSNEIIPDVSNSFTDLLYSLLSLQGLNMYWVSLSISICVVFACCSINSGSEITTVPSGKLTLSVSSW